MKDGFYDVLLEKSDPVTEAKFKMTIDEHQLLLDTCKFKGIQNYVVNPKAVHIDRLMGHFDETSREWTDGLLSYAIRRAANDLSGRRNLVTFDGPIDSEWVENMNSVLDDN